MKTIREFLARLRPTRRLRAPRWWHPVLAVALGLAACAAGTPPANDDFATATVITGATGSTNGNNLLATLEPCETNAVITPEFGLDQITNSVWYVWTAPASGFLEVDTGGSGTNLTSGLLDFVLSVWTSTNAAPTMCDGSLTNLVSDDGFPSYSQIPRPPATFPVVAGTKYYIEVSSFNDGSVDNAGNYQLNWTETIPPVPTGAFKFTSGTYVVSQSDSAAPLGADNNTVSASVSGARITVTRPAPGYGRVLVDYAVSNLTYVNILMTNYYGTNTITEIVSTDIPPIITFSNSYSTNIVSVNGYQQYDNGYFYTYVTNYFTNSATLTENVAYATNNPPVTNALVVVATNMPMLANFVFYTNYTAGGFRVSLAEQVYGSLQTGRRTRGTNYEDGLNFTNSGIVYTNYAVYFTNTYITNIFGTNLDVQYASTAFFGPWYSTNLYYTNLAVGLIYATNSIYTNGVLGPVSVLVTGTNWNVSPAADTTTLVELDFNATNVVSLVTPLVPSTPAPTNWPTVSYSTPIVTSIDPSGNQILSQTNDWAYGVTVFSTNASAAPYGISLVSGTLVFSNLQMSADIYVPVTPAALAGYGQVILSNPRLDPQESPFSLQAPTIAGATAYINALSPNFSSVQTAVGPAGVFNFERSTFRANRNVGTAIISVNRFGGLASDSASVDYIIDPDYPGYYAITPANVDDPVGIKKLYDPANTFPLQAGSDYATPNSDYTPITGTLNWGAYDFQPKQISITISNNGLVEFNEDMMIQLHNALPLLPTSSPPTDPGTIVGQVNQATLTILFDNTPEFGGQYPGQQPAGAADRTWNKDNASDSYPPYLSYPGTTPGFGGTVYAVAEEPDGTALFAGSFVSYDSTPYNRIVRVKADGYVNPAPTFFQGNRADLGNNSGANDYISALALQPDGQILIGGNFTAYNGYNRHYIARLNPDGSLDTSFAPGLGANATVSSVALQANGQVIIAGAFTSYNGVAVNQVARLNPDGSLDTSFVCGALGGGQVVVNAVTVDAAGRVLIGGNFITVAGVNCGAVARLNADGSLDRTFTPGIGTYNPETLATDPVSAILAQADGTVLIGGSFAYYNLVSKPGLARLYPDGTLDLTFASGTGTLNPITGDADTVNTILLQPDGNILIGGDFMAYNQTRRIGLARVFQDGSLDTSFMDAAYNQYAGVPNFYFDQNVVSPTYPYFNTPNAVYAIALENNPITTSSNVLIGGSFEMVGGGAARDSVLPRSNVARVIGGATPGPGNIEMMYNNYSVANSEGSLFVSLIRTNGNLGDISATFSVTTAAPGPGVATAGTDFSPSTFDPTYVLAYTQGPNNAWDHVVGLYGPNYAEVPTVTPRSVAADVVLDIFNPGNISGNLSANFGLSQPTGVFALGGENIPNEAALGADSSAPLTIIDSNVKAGVLGFSSPVYTVVQGSTATITLTRTNGSQNQVTVYYATTDGTATNGVNYTGATNQLIFGIGVTNVTFTIPTMASHSLQPDRTVNLTLFTPSGGATLGLSNATLTVVNSVYLQGHLAFSQTNYMVNENGGNAVVTVNRLGGSTGTLGVTFQTANGTATNGVNYLGITTNLLWNNGDASSRTITIPVMDDGVVTPNLVASLILTNSTVNGTNNPGPLDYGNAASPTNATLTIVNVDSAGSFQFSLGAYSVKKYAGYALVPVTRTNGSIGTAQVSYTTVDATAVQGTDYVFQTNTLTFTNGQVSELITVPILDDGVTNNPSGPKDLLVQLSNPTGGATLGTPNPATLYIIDSESVNETPGTADSPFTFDFNNNVYALTLQANNQLLAGGDFTMADGVTRNHIARLNADGSLDAGFSEPSDNYGANDSVRAIAVQTDGRILVGGAFTNFNGQARGHIARLSADGTLDSLFNPGSGADNSVYAVAETFVGGNNKVLIGGAFASVSGNTFNGIGQLNTDGTPDSTFNAGGLGANNTVYALAVQADGKIIIGGDFTTYNGLANFNHLARLNPDGSADTNFNAVGSGPSDSVRAIAIQLDGRILIGGLFTNVNGQVFNHLARLNADGTVDASFVPGLGANDAVFALGLQSDTRIVVGGEFTTCSGVTRNRITRLNPDGSVDPSINFGTGANDFVAAIAVQEATIVGYPTNVPDEKIIIGGGFTQYNGTTNQNIARIFGGSIGGSGAFQFSSANYQVNENGTNALITVWRTGGTTNAPTGDITVTAYTSNGTAVAGTNYIAVTTNLDFPLGEVTRSFVIPVMDDGVVTPNLTVNLAITNPTAPAEIGNQPTAVLTIINDDSLVCFSNATYSVPKNIVSGLAPITIVRLGGTNNTTTVNFTTTIGGTAVPVTDYTPVTQTVIFNPGDALETVSIPINDNGIAEGNRTVTMQLAYVTGSTLIAPTNATLTIIDTVNAPGELSFASPTYTVTEGGGVGYSSVYITVQRTFGSSGTVSVGFTTQDGTAQSLVKYIPTNGVVTFGDGETSKTFPVAIINTTTAEGPETFSLYLSNPTGNATITSPLNTVVTILNTNTGIAFASAANAFTEPSGPVDGLLKLNVVRFNNTNGTTTVNYSTTNGTAVAGVNFIGVTNGTLTFNPGDSVLPIWISTIHDTNVTGDLFFTVGLGNPSGAAQLTTPSFTLVTDHDADAGISFFTNAVSVYRNAGYVIIPISCSNTNVEPVSVNFATGGGSAVAGTDYTAASGTLTFTNGTFFTYFVVPILLNNSVQSNRTFNVTLSTPTPPGVLVPPAVETVTIIGTNTPAGLSFATPIIIGGNWGVTNVDNTLGAPETGDPTIANAAGNAPVWFEWTAPPGGNGEVTLDTIGSVGTNGLKLDTVLGVYTGSSLSSLNQVAANDDLYPNLYAIQFNESVQNVWNTNLQVTFGGLNGNPLNPGRNGGTNYVGFYGDPYDYYQPFTGPSGLRFNAKAGTTYYIAADTKVSYTYSESRLGRGNGTSLTSIASPSRGVIQLNWAYHPAGVFRFATEDVDQTGITDTNGNPMLLYHCAETEGSGINGNGTGGNGNIRGGGEHGQVGPFETDHQLATTVDAYYYYDVNGLLVTVTRVAGSSGRMLVDYATQDGNTNLINNGDVPALGSVTNVQFLAGYGYYTNVTTQDYTPVSGTLIFDDFEMSKTIVIPIWDDGGTPQPNRDFFVVLSNPRRDPAETTAVSNPRVDPIFGKVLCRILDCDIDPNGPSPAQIISSNAITGVVSTNYSITDQRGQILPPTNGIFNFAKANYRIPRDVQNYWTNRGAATATPVTVYVNRMGTNTSSVTVHYRFDSLFLDNNSVDDGNNEFPLQPGSDYATPTPPNASDIAGTNSDFAGVGGDSGTLTFPGGKNNPFQSQPIHFNINENQFPQFNEDIHITLYELDSNGNPFQCGMVSDTTVTMLFDDTYPTAGSVDEYFNPDFASDMALLTIPYDFNSLVPNPGADGQVNALAWLTNGESIIGGAFYSYADSTNSAHIVNGIARLYANGQLDPGFNSGVGINVASGSYIQSLALTPDNKIVIGGNFTSYNNQSRSYIARLNLDGSLDTTFTNLSGFNGMVWCVQVQTDGKVLAGGNFTSYAGIPCNYIARLNTDGSLDTTFNSSNLITGPVQAIALAADQPFSFAHASSNGNANQDVQVLNLGLQTTGTLNVYFNTAAGINEMQIFYGSTNVAAGTGVLLYDSGAGVGTVTGLLPFGPVGGFATNVITVVMNPGGQPAGYSPWNYSLTMPGQTNLMIGGQFTVTGQSYANIARLNGDGSLDSSFNPGTGPDGPVLALAWQEDQKIVLGGSFKSLSGVGLNNLARLNADGSIDANYNNGTGTDGSVNCLTLQPVSVKLYAGGSFTTMNGTHRLGFARLYADGTVDTTFLDTAYNQYAGLPRILYSDAPGTVYAAALQGDGNVLIGGSFQEVGGGQADKNVRGVLEEQRGLEPSTGDSNLWVSEEQEGLGQGENLEPKTRDGVRNRSNIARLIGGATPGPGNIGMVSGSYAATKTQVFEPVTLVRANGLLGYASANFAVLPALAQSGVDYSYQSPAPLYPINWEYGETGDETRMHSDGLAGANGLMQDAFGRLWQPGVNGPASVNVSIIDNTASSGNLSAEFQMSNPSGVDQFYLGGQDIPLGVALGQSQAPLTIVDNAHQDGVIGFASPSYAATNSPLTLTLTRTNGTYGQVQVNYQTVTNGSTAVANVDYRPTNGVVAFAAGYTTPSTPALVTILNNSYISPQEKTLNVQLYNLQDFTGGNAQLGLTNAVVRIINPNYPGYLSFNTNAYYANLSAGTINFTVTRTVGGKGTLTVQYGTVDGTAHNGVNYVGSTNTLTWNSADVSPRTVSIPLINPNVTGPVRTFSANLFNATLNGTNVAGLMGAITNAVFAIVNDNSYGTFQFSSPSYQVNENGGYATISVTRSGAALGNASVNFATVDGTAFAGTNYVATNNTLTFLPGQLLQSFNVQLLNNGKTNNLPPASFYFGVALSSPSSGAYLGSPTNALVRLVNAQEYNQPPGSVDLSFDASVNASVLGLALQSSGQVVAAGSFTVADGTSRIRLARFNTDGTLDGNFQNGMTGANNSVNTVVSQTDDHILVGGAFSLINSINCQRIARLMTDGSLDTSFNPGAGADNTVFALSEAFLNGARVVYAGGAFGNFEGMASPGLVRLTDSGAVDSSFSVGEGVVGTVYALAVYPTNSVYDAGDVLVGGTFTNYNGTIVGNLVRLNPDGSLDTNFTQNVLTDGAVRAITIQLDGRVLIGGGFTHVNGTAANQLARLNADGTLDTAFATNAAPGINGTVTAIALQQDNRIVVAGQFTTANGVTRNDLTRLLPTGAVDPTINFGAGANGAVNTVVIQPTDGNLVIGGDFTQFNGQTCDHIARLFGGSETGSGAFRFTSANYQVDEDGGFAAITVQRTGGTSGTNADGSGTVYVAFTTTNGTAVAGVNYTYTTNYLAFPAGEVFENVQVPVQDDGVVTPNLTVDLSLSNPTPGTGLGDQATALLTIINDDNFVEFQSPTYQVPKNTVNGFANIQIVRLGSTSGSCTVNFETTTNGTAVIGTDYYPTNQMITFLPGFGTNFVQIPIINNGLVEGNRTVAMVLTNVFNSVLGSPSNAVLTIQDTVQAPGNLYFTATNYYANASDGVAYLSVGRTNGTSGSVSVTYTTVQGTAIPGLNYVATTNTLTFNDGDTNLPCRINLINNQLAQAPVSLTVFLSTNASANGAGLIAPTNATLVIANTNAVFAFTLATNIVAEDQGTASLVVQRFNNTNIVSTVNYTTTNLTAFANTNFIGITNGLLTFTVGETFQSIAIPLFNRSNINNLVFGVNLSNPTHAQLVAPSNTVVILEPSAAGVSFTTNAVTVNKPSATAPSYVPIAVVCSNPRVEPVVTSNTGPLEVAFTTVDGSAKAGVNYAAVAGTLLFTNGLGTNYINVTLFGNQLVSSNLTFSVLLTNVTAPGHIAPYGTQAVTIAESNIGMSFSQANYNVFKNSGLAIITVNRSGSTNGVASVDYFVTNGTAIGGQNFYPTNGTLLFTNGVTSQTFNVALIANTQVQPNLFAFMELLNPTNADVVTPATATLTILENGGSYVIPSGALLLTNSSAADMAADVIGSNDTVLVTFAFRDSAGLNVTNLIAYLQATNGVTAPSPASQTYGPLTTYGHSVSKNFSFTAHGTNTFTISPTFQLYDNGKYIGPATFVFTVGAWVTTFANTNPIILYDDAAASLYPSLINASGLGSTLIKATVTVTNLSHQNFVDIDALLVSPTTNTLIMGHVAGSRPVKNVTLTFDDAATNSLPQNSAITSGTNKPTQYGTIPNFP